MLHFKDHPHKMPARAKRHLAHKYRGSSSNSISGLVRKWNSGWQFSPRSCKTFAHSGRQMPWEAWHPRWHPFNETLSLMNSLIGSTNIWSGSTISTFANSVLRCWTKNQIVIFKEFKGDIVVIWWKYRLLAHCWNIKLPVSLHVSQFPVNRGKLWAGGRNSIYHHFQLP